MCIVIDLNRIPSVFNPQASDHGEFQPVLDWIDNRNARIVYGGTKYKTELRKMPKYFGILLERKKAGQVYEADDESVDVVEEEINEKTRGTTFNDQAIVAIVIVSRCRLICSNDISSFFFLRLQSLYRTRRILNVPVYIQDEKKCSLTESSAHIRQMRALLLRQLTQRE